MDKKQLINIGKIIGVFGIKGELKVYSESDFVTYRFRVGAHIILKNKNIVEEVIVSRMRLHQKNILIEINQMKDINLVQKYIGFDIYTSSDDQPPLSEDEYYIDDLIGLDAFDQNNKKIGIVHEFIEVPQGYILEIQKENKKILIPFVDEYILDVLEDKIVVKVLESC